MEDKICLSFCLCVLSTSVFLLALCHFTLKKRGTKKKNRSSTTVPQYLQNLFQASFPPRSRLLLSSVLLGPVELLSPYQPNHTHVAAASRPLRITSRPRLEQAGGSPCGRHRGLPPVQWLYECALVSVYLFSRLGQSDQEHIKGGPNETRLSNACLHIN